MTKKLLTLTFVGLSTIANGMFYTGEKAFNDLCQNSDRKVAFEKMIDEANKHNMGQWGMNMNTTPHTTASASYADKAKATFTQAGETAKAAMGSFSTAKASQTAQAAMDSVKGAPQAAFKAADGAVRNDPRLFGAFYAGGLAAVAAGIGVANKFATEKTPVPVSVAAPSNVERAKEMGQKALAYAKDHKAALATVAVAVPAVAVASKVAVKKAVKAYNKPTVEQIVKDNHSVQALISSLRKHGYTAVDVKASDLVSSKVNETQAAFVVSCLS